MPAAPLSLVTGGSGYLGSFLVKALAARDGACRVVDLHAADDLPRAAEVTLADVRDREAMRRACAGVDVVYHAVAQVPLARDRELFWSVNVDGTRALLEAALDAGVRKVVLLSSSAVYGAPRANPVSEDTPPTPMEPYGRSKLEGERVATALRARGLDVSIVRPRTILGPGRLGIFQILFEWVRRGKNVPVLGRGDNVYQFIHTDDLIDACLLAAARPGPGVYNIGAARFGTMRACLERLCAHAGTGSRVKSVPLAPAEWAMRLTGALRLTPLGPYHALMYGRSLWFDISRARRELGWQPRKGNDEAMIDSYEWYVANRERLLAATGPASHHRSALRRGALRAVELLL